MSSLLSIYFFHAPGKKKKVRPIFFACFKKNFTDVWIEPHAADKTWKSAVIACISAESGDGGIYEMTFIVSRM